jgi:hypothetical protein
MLLVLAAGPAAAAPDSAKDWFTGTAVVPPGGSPVQVDPHDVVIGAGGAVGFGYRYQANGAASGQLDGTFQYQEHGYLFFSNPSDPSTLVGSRFESGVFTLTPNRADRKPVKVADTAPDKYTSGIKNVADKVRPQVTKNLGILGHDGPLTYGYFTFTNTHGTFTGYATPDFMHFIIQIEFDLAQ